MATPTRNPSHLVNWRVIRVYLLTVQCVCMAMEIPGGFAVIDVVIDKDNDAMLPAIT